LSKSTILAHGAINGADSLTIEFIQPADHPPIVRIVWPPKTRIIPPATFPAAAAAAVAARLFAVAPTKVSQVKAQR
jgi:hypothetical protein